MAPLMLTSSGNADLFAETQWAQLLSQAKVHRHGTMNRGPLFFKPYFSAQQMFY